MSKYLSTLIIVIYLTTYSAISQTIQLVDEHLQTPIAHATYVYGQQKGVSNNLGTFSLKYETNTSLIISHINYGKRIIDGKLLEETLQNGIFYWRSRQVELQPISIIALHQATSDSLTIFLNNQNRLAHDAASILSQTPEIALIRKSGNYGFDPVLRGFKYEQLNIVLDGAQSALAACPNRMDPPISQMPVNMLSQISILKGPYSLRYGNGFGGTINFKTEKARFNSDKTIYGRFSGSYENNGDVYRSEGLLGFSGQRHNINIFGSIADGNSYQDGNGRLIPSAFHRNSVGGQFAFLLNKKQDIKLNISHNYAKNVDFPALPMDLRKDDTWLGSVHHTIRFKGKLQEWNTTLYSTYVDHLMDNYDKVLAPRMVDAVTNAQTYNYGARTEGYWQMNQNHLYIGFEFRADKAEGERSRHFLIGPKAGNTLFDNIWQDAFVHKAAVFGEFQQRINQWQFVYSARVEHNYANADKPDAQFESIYDKMHSNILNPAISAGVSKSINQSFSAELWLGHAQRSGSLTERFINFLPVGIDPYEMLGNPNLSSEKNNQVDISLKYSSSSTQVQLSVFSAFLRDYISSEIRDDIAPLMPSSPGVRQYININKARLMGFEANWLQKLPAQIQQRLSLAYTYGKNQETNEALPEIPPLDIRYRLSGQYFKKHLHPEIAFRYVTKQNRIADSYGESTTPSFSTIDVSVNYKINEHVEINVAANNLLDQTYYEHLSRPVKGTREAINAPGRNLIITCVAKL